MLRWMMPLLAAVFAIGSAEAADGPVATKRAAKQLPPHLPRLHYTYRTTVAPAAAPRYVRRGRQLVIEEDPAAKVSPIMPYVPFVNGEPITALTVRASSYTAGTLMVLAASGRGRASSGDARPWPDAQGVA